MARAEHEPITGVWGQSLQRGAGAARLVRESGGQIPLKLLEVYQNRKKLTVSDKLWICDVY